MKREEISRYLNVQVGPKGHVVLTAEDETNVVHVNLTREQVGKLVMWLHRYMTEVAMRELEKGE